MSVATSKINSHDRDLLTWNLRGYLDNISWLDEGEILPTGEALNHIFEPLKQDASAVAEVAERASSLSQYALKLSKTAQSSLEVMTDSILEVYREPSDWVLPDHSGELRKLILSSVDHRATQLIRCSPSQRQELIKKRKEHIQEVASWQTRDQEVKMALFGTTVVDFEDSEQSLRYSVACSLTGYRELYPEELSQASVSQLFDSKLVALDFLQHESQLIRLFSQNIQRDRDVVFTAYKKSHYILKWVDIELRKCPQMMEKCLAFDGRGVEYLDDSLKKDEFLFPIALKSQSEQSYLLKFCSQTLRSDPANILTIMQSDPDAFFFASEKLRNDNQFILKALKKNGNIFKCFNQEQKKNPLYLHLALKTPGRWIANASNDFRQTIIDLLSDFERARDICLGTVLKTKELIQEDQWVKNLDFRQKSCSDFRAYVSFCNPLLRKNIDFWQQVLQMEPILVTSALRINPTWSKDPVILERLKSSHQQVRDGLDAFPNVTTSELLNLEFYMEPIQRLPIHKHHFEKTST